MNYLVIFFADYAIFAVFALVFYLWWVGARKTAAHAALASGLSWLVGQFVKDFFYFPRPFVSQVPLSLHRFTDGSFPSNHTASAFAISTAVFLARPKLGSALLLVSLLIGTARVLGGVHYPLDVSGGAALGVTTAFLTRKFNFAHILKVFHLPS